MSADELDEGHALEAQARTLHLEFDYAGSMRAYDRAYKAYRREGNLLAAARAARTLGWFHGSVYGDWAVYRGWLGRAVSLLEQAGVDSNEHGWVLLARAQSGGGLDVQQRTYEDAIATARRCQDGDLECEALASLGIMLAFSGHVTEGMARLDESLAAICAGEVDDLSVVEGVFCGLFNACERTNDVGRAEQWLRAARGAEQLADACHLRQHGGEVCAAEVARRERVEGATLGTVEEGEGRQLFPCRIDGEGETPQVDLQHAVERVAELPVEPALVAQALEVGVVDAVVRVAVLGCVGGDGVLHPAQQR